MIELTQVELAIRNAWFAENDPDEIEFCHTGNFRYAHKGNETEEAAYREAADGGCCGSVDTELTLPDGQVLLFGFNYGY